MRERLMLPDYGVVIGQYNGHETEQGRWLHVDLNIAAGASTYQAAVDVNEPNGQFQYQLLRRLDKKLFGSVAALADGWHHLDSTPASGAIDYARSPILQKPLGCLLAFWALVDAIFGSREQAWTNVTGNEAGEALISIVVGSTRVFAFGAPYTTGLGVHDVHCNQGDPPGEFQGLDGIWQDGCVFATQADGTLAAYLGKFTSQTLKTNTSGLPA